MTQPTPSGVPNSPPVAPTPLVLGGITVGGAANTALPVDPSTGMVSIWNTPAGLTAAEADAFWNTKIWFGTGINAAPEVDKSVKNREVRSSNPENGPLGAVDQNASASDVMKQYAAMAMNDAPGFKALQLLLYQGGFYNGATAIYGGFNGQTETAIATALQQYIKSSQGTGTPVNFQDFLQHQRQLNLDNGNSPFPGAAGGGGGLSSSPTLTDPDTLQRYANMAAQAAFGRGLTQDELNKFVTTFHNQQVQSYTDAANHNGLTSVKDDPRASAINFVEQSNPQEFGQHQAAAYTDTFLNMFLSGTSAAPAINPDVTGSVGL